MLQKEIALLLIKRSQRQIRVFIFHVVGERVLHRTVGDEGVELMHLAKFRHQVFRRERIAHFPAGHRIGFAKRVHHEAAFGQARH